MEWNIQISCQPITGACVKPGVNQSAIPRDSQTRRTGYRGDALIDIRRY